MPAGKPNVLVSTAETLTETEPITSVAERLNWTVVSMQRDWSSMFPTDPIDPL